MYLLQRKKIYIYANISLFLSYSEVTVATRSSPYPAQMVTAVTRSSPYPDQMVDQHLETTTTALNISGDQDPQMSPRDRSPVRTPSPRHPSGKDPWNQWTTYTLTLLQLEQTAGSSGRRRTGPLTEPGFSQVFFLRSVTDGGFGSLPLSPLACLVGDTSFPAISSSWLHRYYLNWT